jgi:hypothetical protein
MPKQFSSTSTADTFFSCIIMTTARIDHTYGSEQQFADIGAASPNKALRHPVA